MPPRGDKEGEMRGSWSSHGAVTGAVIALAGLMPAWALGAAPIDQGQITSNGGGSQLGGLAMNGRGDSIVITPAPVSTPDTLDAWMHPSGGPAAFQNVVRHDAANPVGFAFSGGIDGTGTGYAFFTHASPTTVQALMATLPPDGSSSEGDTALPNSDDADAVEGAVDDAGEVVALTSDGTHTFGYMRPSGGSFTQSADLGGD